MNYYNEIDPYAAQWLRNLIEAGLIPRGVVDERSIADVNPEDLSSYTQCHFFAGIGGWSYALALADWPASRPVWTGSCPCQPFSCAGKREGISDSRHLWPEFFRLIRDYNRIAEHPIPTIFGEQVASKDGLRWLDGVQTDVEGAGYAFGAADLCAAGVGAPHIRQRLYWVAHASSTTSERRTGGLPAAQTGIGSSGKLDGDMPERLADGGEDGRLAHTTLRGNGDSECQSRECARGVAMQRSKQESACLEKSAQDAIFRNSGMGIPDSAGPQPGRESTEDNRYRSAAESAGCWSDCLLIPCWDGKVRKISSQSSDVPLAHGIPRDVGRMFPGLAGMVKGAKRNRVGRLKGYGNAIVPQVAAEFIKAYTDARL